MAKAAAKAASRALLKIKLGADGDPDRIAAIRNAAPKATLIVDGTGTATTETKMYLVGLATAGVCELRLSATDTGTMLTDTDFFSDVELTDANGEVFTFVMPDSIRVVEAYTNRTTG